MAKKNILEKRVWDLLNPVLQACDALDSSDELKNVINNINPEEEIKNICKQSLLMFNISIAASDGEVDDTEMEIINSLSGTDYSKSSIQGVIKKFSGGKSNALDTFMGIVVIFEIADNLGDKTDGKNGVAMMLYELFATSGAYIITAGDDVKKSGYDRLIFSLKMIYDDLKKNLKYGFGDIQRPEKMLNDILNAAEIELDPSITKKGSKRVKEGASDVDAPEETLEELLAELDSMVGLNEVKYDVISLMNLMRVKMLREKQGLKMPPISMHLVFSGNPGTGKTTVARLLAKIYKQIGVLSKGQLVEVDRAGLVGGYVGQTALKVRDVVKSAIGGVLFIDEAYSLTPECATNDYGLEAVDTIVKSMEDYREDLVVIVAGYPDLMDRFLKSNPGLRSRFNKFISFKDYTPEELTQIFIMFCNKHGYRPSRPALDYVLDYFRKRCANKQENFANAREVRNLFEFGISRQANRVMLLAEPSQDNLTLLKREDIAGESNDYGKQQYLAQKLINDLNRVKRHGIDASNMGISVDELELPAGAEELLYRNKLKTIGRIMDFIDGGNDLATIPGMNDEAEGIIIKELEELGYQKRAV